MKESKVSPPEGTVTFLFTDIEGSTERWGMDPEAASADLILHDRLVRKEIEDRGGYVFKTVGDGFCAAFPTAASALAAALGAQAGLGKAEWRGPPVKVRMGVHAGVAELRDGDYFGLEPSRTARIAAAGSGGQIVLSESAWVLVKEAPPAGVEFTDLGLHRLKGIAGSERLRQAALSGMKASFPPLKDLDLRPNNLPPESTSFIGREKELADLLGLLEASRLVTLSGPGGAGKTRLALRAARGLLDRYEDGIWFADLSLQTAASGLPATLVAALGLREAQGVPPADLVRTFLAERELLLILDNCEHLIEAAASTAADLLAACPGLRILATSREPLEISGEAVYRLPPLSSPEPDPSRHRSAQSLVQYEAVRLFIERARAATAGFRVDDESAPWIAEICSRLDGIALAIELAAAKCAFLSLHDIAQRLAERFELLRSPSRTSSARQRTLRNLIDWSWDLLGPEERRCLSRLALYQGSFGMEAARETAGPGAEELLESLVAKSLVCAELSADQADYRLLESIREYALERLEDSGDEEQARAAFGSRLDRISADAYRRIFTRGGTDLIAAIFAERDNYSAVIRERLGRGEAAGLELLGNSGWALLFAGYFGAVRTLCDAGMSLLGEDPLPASLVPFLATAARSLLPADFPAARSITARALAAARAAGEKGLEARSAVLEGTLERGGGLAFGFGGLERGHCDFARALEHYEVAEALALESGERHALVEAFGGKGIVKQLAGKPEEALAWMDKARDIARAEHDLLSLGWIEMGRRAPLAALDRNEEALRTGLSALALAELAGDPQLCFMIHEGLSGTLLELGRYGEAAVQEREALRLADRLGAAWMREQAEFNLLRPLGEELCFGRRGSDRLVIEREFSSRLEAYFRAKALGEEADGDRRMEDALIYGAFALLARESSLETAAAAAAVWESEFGNQPWIAGERKSMKRLDSRIRELLGAEDFEKARAAGLTEGEMSIIARLARLVPELACLEPLINRRTEEDGGSAGITSS